MPVDQQLLQELENIQSRNDTLLNPNNLTEQIDLNTGQVVNSPVGISGGLLQAEARVTQGVKPENIVGSHGRFLEDNEVLNYIGADGIGGIKESVLGFASGISNLVFRVPGALAIQAGQQLAEPIDEVENLNDFLNYISTRSIFTRGVAGSLPGFEREAFQRLGVPQRLDRIGNDLIERNRQFAIENGLAFDEENQPTLMFMVSEGATSLVAALGLAVATRSPTAAAAVFGGIQQSETYLNAVEAGKGVGQATALANVAGVVVGMLEQIGIGQMFKLMKNPTGRVLSRFIQGAIVEGTQEGAQTAAVLALEEFSNINDITFSEGLRQVASATTIGAILGGPATAGGGSIADRATRRAVADPATTDTFARQIANQVGDALDVDIEIDQDADQDAPATQNGKTRKSARQKVGEIMEAFNFAALTGQASVADVFQTEQQKQKFIDSTIERMRENRRVEVEDVAVRRIRVLDRETSEILQELEVVEETEVRDEAKVTRLTDRLSQIETERETLSSELRRGEAVEQIQRTQVQVAASALSTLRKNTEVQAFQKGIKEGKKVGRERAVAVSKAVLGAIQRMPISDKAKARLQQRVTTAINTKSNKALSNVIDSIFKQGEKATVRETRKSLRTRLTQTIKTKKPSRVRGKLVGKTSSEKVNNMLDGMSKVTDRVEASESIDVLTADTNPDPYTDMEIRHAQIVRQGGRVGLVEVAQFLDDLDAVIESGSIPDILDVVRERRIQEAREGILEPDLPSTSELQKVRGGWFYRFTDTTIHPLIQTYNTLLDQMSVGDNSLLRIVREDMLYRSNIGALTRKIQSFVQSVPGLTDYNHFKSFKKDGDITKGVDGDIEYEINTQRVVGEIEKFNQPLEDLRVEQNNLRQDIESLKGAPVEDDFELERLRDELASVSKEISTILKKVKGFASRWISDEAGLSSDYAELVAPKTQGGKGQDITIPEITGILSQSQRESEIRHVRLERGMVIQRLMEIQNPELRDEVTDPTGQYGYDEAVIDKLNALMTEADRSLMDFIFQEYEKFYDRINEVYSRLFKVDLPRVEFYAQIAREHTDGSGELRGFLSQVVARDPSAEVTSVSFIKSRSTTNAALKERDAMDVFQSYAQEAEYFIAYAEKMNDINAVLRDTEIRNSIIKRVGTRGLDRLDKHLDVVRKMGRRDTITKLNMIDSVRKNFITSALALKPQIGFKQITSVFAFAEDMPMTEFISGIGHYIRNRKQALETLRGHESILFRGRHLDNEFDVLYNSQRFGFWGEKNTVRDFFMFPIVTGDVIPIHMGGWAMFRNLTRRGFSEADALQKVAEKAEASQQTTLPSNLTLLQKEGGSIARFVTMFTSSPVALINMQMQAYSKYRNSARTSADFRQMIKSLTIYQIVIPGFFAWIASAFEPPEEEEFLRNSIVGAWGAMPLLGDVTGFIATVLVNEIFTDAELREFQLSGVSNPVDEFTTRMTRDAKNLLDEDGITFMDFMDALGTTIDITTGLPGTTGVNILDGLLGTEEDDTLDGLFTVMGFSDYAIEQRE